MLVEGRELLSITQMAKTHTEVPKLLAMIELMEHLKATASQCKHASSMTVTPPKKGGLSRQWRGKIRPISHCDSPRDPSTSQARPFVPTSLPPRLEETLASEPRCPQSDPTVTPAEKYCLSAVCL